MRSGLTVNVNTLGFTLVSWEDTELLSDLIYLFLKIRIILSMVSRIDCRTEMDPQGDGFGVYFNCPKGR